MAEAAPIVHIGENSPEEVAFRLMSIIMNVENRQPHGHGKLPVDREWVLRTYAQCMRAVKLPQMINDVVKEFQPEIGPRQQ